MWEQIVRRLLTRHAVRALRREEQNVRTRLLAVRDQVRECSAQCNHHYRRDGDAYDHRTTYVCVVCGAVR